MLMSEEGLAVLLTLSLGYKERHNAGNLCIFLKSQRNHHVSIWSVAMKPRQIRGTIGCPAISFLVELLVSSKIGQGVLNA